MKLYNVFSMATVALATLFFTACEPDHTVIKIKALPPIIEGLDLENERIIYGETPQGTLKIVDAEYNLKEVKIDIMLEGSQIYSKTLDKIESPTLSFSLHELGEILPFEPNVVDKFGAINVTVTNIKLKKVSESFDFVMKRPEFDKLYAFVEGKEYELNSSDGCLYSVDLTEILPNGVTGFIYSKVGQKGLKWGYDKNSKMASLASEDPIPFINSESAEGKITSISFDIMKFIPSPLEKFLSVNGVTFVPTKDENVLLASNIAIEPQQVVEAILFNLDEVTFDPDFFEVAGEKTIKYIGASQSINLYYNTQLRFVFVDSEENPFHVDLNYPNNTMVLGYGVGCPSMKNEPGWDFNHGISFRKIASSEYNVYTQTIVVNQDTYFNFYSDSSTWDQPVTADKIEFLDDAFYSHEEDGKPGSWVIEQTVKDNTKLFVYKIVYTVKDGIATFSSTKLREVSIK